MKRRIATERLTKSYVARCGYTWLDESGYKAVNNQAPIYLTTLFNRVSSVTSRSLRNSELNIRPPRLKTKHGQNCFAYRGAMVWNSLPSDCKKANSFQSYKMKLKAMLAKL